jgi:ADP-heptose:LPS heptosyltransferase
LFIRLSAVGDVVNALVPLAALRRAAPGAHITFVVEDRCKELVLNHPHVSDVLVYERRRWAGTLAGHVKRLRSVGADVALDFQGNLKGALHAWLSRTPRRIGFARGHTYEGAHAFATETVEPPSRRIPRAEKFMCLLRPLGITAPAPRALPPLPGRRIEGDYVLLHPGTSVHGAQKRWPPDRWAALADRIAASLRVVWAAGPGEEELVARIRAGMKRPSEAASPGSLLDLAATARDARLFVGCDSGPLHLAAAAGCRCVGLYGPKDPAVYAPYPADGHEIVAPDEPRPMDWLDVATAAAAVERCL